jgi:glycosyltransferase involved in cell wall biosynthesis
MLSSISSGSWDIINAGFLPWSTPFLVSLCVKKSATPLVITPFFHVGQTYHEMYSTYLVLNKATAIFALTQSEKEVFIAHGIPAEKIHVVRGGIDPARYSGANGVMFRSRYGIPNDSFVVLFLGTRDFEKGYHHTILAMKEVWKSIASAKLVTIGRKGTLKSWDKVSKAYRQYTRHVIEANSENIIDLGLARDQDVKDALDASDVLVLPSRAESFGMVYLEAGLFKKPVIGARIPTTCEMIVDGQDGFLVKFGDYPSLASHLIKLAKNPQKREKIGENWYQKVKDVYRWDVTINRIEAIYEELVAKTK